MTISTYSLIDGTFPKLKFGRGTYIHRQTIIIASWISNAEGSKYCCVPTIGGLLIDKSYSSYYWLFSTILKRFEKEYGSGKRKI